MNTRITKKGLAFIVLITVGVLIFHRHGRWIWTPIWHKIAGKRTVAEVLEKYGPSSEARLKPHFDKAGASYPPQELILLAFKQERLLELWASTKSGPKKIKTYPFTGYSGHLGPKLRKGDYQIPEGVYKIDFLNPNSSYHLSMRVDYPNVYDQKMANDEGRTDLGGDIFIHGKSVTIGCIPIGDKAIEEIFCLVANVGMDAVKVIISPCDFRKSSLKTNRANNWTVDLYQELKSELKAFKES
jgi:murein L,D-transpeptidase YafK